MTALDIGWLMLAAMLALIWLGMHVGVALSLLSVIGVWLMRDSFVLSSKFLALSAYDAIANHIDHGAAVSGT